MTRALKFVLPLLLLALGGLGVFFVTRIAPSEAEAESATRNLPVQIARASAGDHVAEVTTTGLVVPALEVTLSSEVSGRIVEVSSSLEPGGMVRRGDVLARIDAREYRLAIRQEESRLRSSELELENERGRVSVARREWEILGDGRPESEAGLALRRPHLETAEASLDGARASLERARLNLSRTTIRAPFDAVVIDEAAEVGQVVSPGARLATLVGTERVWARVAVPAEQLPLLAVPGVNGDIGSSATVIHELGREGEVRRAGQVARLEGQLDGDTRMARLLIEVPDPFTSPEGAVPLLPGTLVRVVITGQPMPGVVAIPREALRDGNTVWVVDDDEGLERRTVDVRFGSDRRAFIREGLAHDDRVVVSPMASPLVGMAVSVSPDEGTALAEAGVSP